MNIRQMITMSEDMHARLRDAAGEDGISMSEVVRRALRSRFESIAGDMDLIRQVRAFRNAEYKRRPASQPPSISEAADALTQMGWDVDKAMNRVTDLAAANPEAMTADLITLALKVSDG